jgi:hypothetical protein
MYNLTYITDEANSLYDIAKATNDLSGGLYFSLVILVLFITYMIVFKKQSFKEVFVAASFFTVVISVIMFTLGFVNSNFIIIPVIMFGGSLITFYFVKD